MLLPRLGYRKIGFCFVLSLSALALGDASCHVGTSPMLQKKNINLWTTVRWDLRLENSKSELEADPFPLEP